MSAEAFYQAEAAAEPTEYQQMLLGLYNKSILKQAKFAAINKYLASTETCRCLDIGADNGVLSYLLRKNGGDWSSADLQPSVVASIKKMVGDQVELFDGGRTRFADQTFDIVVIIDFLEHIEDDRAFLAELNRIMKPGGQLIINVPHFRKNSWIRKLRLACGLSDEKHGHVRPGYNLLSLQVVCGDYFEIAENHTYSKFFVELYDVIISLLFERMAYSGGEPSNEISKGVVVTGDDLHKHRNKFKLFSVIYPFVWSLAQFDKLLFWTQGHSLIVQARKRS